MLEISAATRLGIDSKRLWMCSCGTADQAASTRCQSLSASRPGKQINLVIDEEPLDNACHVWSRIILLKYGCCQALKVRKDNWLQHLRDVALDLSSTGNAYQRIARVISNTAPYHNTRCRTSVVVYNAAVQHPLSSMSPDSNPTIVVLQTDA
ncbi:uncharacterized protein TNCV_3822531 [Trichonephila clavipes]|nr:uncharacterized protein TNCV_3822531 [Trichonephila clavipes]